VYDSSQELLPEARASSTKAVVFVLVLPHSPGMSGSVKEKFTNTSFKTRFGGICGMYPGELGSRDNVTGTIVGTGVLVGRGVNVAVGGTGVFVAVGVAVGAAGTVNATESAEG